MLRLLCFPGLALLALTAGCFDPESPATTEGTGTDGVDTGSGEEVGSGDPTASCTNLQQDGDETDIDCGGSCGPCLDGQVCGTDEDCESQWCLEGVCTSPSCDDGVLDGNETDVDCGGSCMPCDDGSGCMTPPDCVSGVCTGGTCQAPVCGDGVANDASEQCDDGGDSETCNADCTLAACGDGIVNMEAGEDCEAPAETADCDADCTAVECGDGTHNATAGEECDDGGNSAMCDADCTLPACGDGLPNPEAGEDCDDGGESAACDVDCTVVECGDGLANPTAGEQCDDGDMIDDNVCSNACLFNACSFDVSTLPVMVHSGSPFGELDFDGACNLLVSGSYDGTLIQVGPAGVSVLATIPGVNSANGVAYRASDDRTYMTTASPAQLWSVTPAGATNMVMNLPVTMNAIEVAPPGFGPYGDQIVGVMTNGQVMAIDPATGGTTVVGTFGATLSDLVFDPMGTVVFLADYSSGQVAAMDPMGSSMVVATFSGPDGLALDPATATLFVATTSGGNAITAVDLMTGMQNVIANPSLNGGYYVTGLLYEAGGNLLVKVTGTNVDYVAVP